MDVSPGMKVAVVLSCLIVLAGCAHAQPSAQPRPIPSRSPVNLAPDGYQGRFRVVATVLANASHGPQLCSAVADSYPPQCGGPDIAGWTWNGLTKESANGVTWGNYLLVGKFDGKTFTLTEAAKAPDPNSPAQRAETDTTSPCPVPPGGWKPVDSSRATDEGLQTVNQLVQNDPDFGGLWLDNNTPKLIDGTPASDPGKYVINVKFTKDLARHEADIRKVWGGSLCVSQARHTMTELSKIQSQLTDPGMTFSSVDIISETVDLGVFLATESRQRELDVKYGTGMVNLVGQLEPID